MTLGEALDRFDLLYPNAMEPALKTALVSRLEGRLQAEIFSLYAEGNGAFAGYDAVDDRNTALLAPFPFDDIYIKFLCAENDLICGDTERYRNSAAVFNSAFEAMAAYYNRTRRIGKQVRLRAE